MVQVRFMSLQPDLILRARWVVPVVPQGRVIHDGAIALKDDHIVAVGPADDLLAQYEQTPVEHYPEHVIMPGLVNAHTHAAMALLKGVGDDLPLQRWLGERIWPLEGQLMSHAFVRDGTRLAAAEMLLGGTTCFNDMYFFPEATIQAGRSLGMRVVAGIIVIDFPSAYGSGPKEYLSKGLALRDHMRGDDLVSFTLAPHAPYTVSDELFAKVATLSGELGLPVSCHLHETAHEVQESLEKYGKRPLRRLADLGLVNSDLIAIHAVHCNAEDIEMLARAQAHVAHCPHSNLKLASGIAPIAQMQDAGITICIGTDGSASNNRLDLWSEARTASLLVKGVSGDAAKFPAEQVLHALTLGAAQALGLSEQIGSVEPGKAADLIAVNLGSPATQPVFDPISHLAYCVGPEHVDEVWIAGRHVVAKRQLVAAITAGGSSDWAEPLSLWHNQVGEILSGGSRP